MTHSFCGQEGKPKNEGSCPVHSTFFYIIYTYFKVKGFLYRRGFPSNIGSVGRRRRRRRRRRERRERRRRERRRRERRERRRRRRRRRRV